MTSATSIRTRLSRYARSEGLDFQRVLLRYATGRFLWRLDQSRFADQFVLKGAQLFTIWMSEPHRATRDLDFLDFQEDSEERILEMLCEICSGNPRPDDGLEWDTAGIQVSAIRDEMLYGGYRAKILSTLDGARIPLKIDIGFGDVVWPNPKLLEWPELLDLPKARVATYPPETVIAEKLEAMVRLDLLNSRMKDFFDLYWLRNNFEISSSDLETAILKTFRRRNTEIPSAAPVALPKGSGWIPVSRSSGTPSFERWTFNGSS